MTRRVVLCDLDDTLVDHTHATRASLASLRAAVPAFSVWSSQEFEARHSHWLETLHAEVLAGRLALDAARAERFRRLLEAAGGPSGEADALDAAQHYRAQYERSWQAVAGALDLAIAIRSAGLALAIVTNNLVAEQRAKLERCGLAPHVTRLVASEEAGICKPDPRIFHRALEWVGAPASSAVMLGDAWALDIEGARAAGVAPVWFNRHGAVSPDASVAELRALTPTGDVLRVLTDAA